MLTPRFSLRQTPTHVYVTIHVPSFRLALEVDGGMEVVLLNGNSEFHFYATPYLLKLNFFPHAFENQDDISSSNSDDDETDGGDAVVSASADNSSSSAAKYDPSEQTVVIPLRKKVKQNENNDDKDNYWPDLELTARLIEPKEIPKKWLHSVIDNNTNTNAADGGDGSGDGSENSEDNDDDEDGGSDKFSSINNRKPLLLPGEQSNSNTGDGYGFQQMFRNIFTDYCRSGLAEEMLMLRRINPESSTLEERRLERHSKEEADFDFDRYFTDLELTEDDYLYPMVMAYQPWWRRNRKESNTKDEDADDDGTELATDFEAKLKVEPTNKDNDDDDGSNKLANEFESKLKVTKATAAEDDDTNDDNNSNNTTDSLFTDTETLLLSTIPYPLLTHSSTTNNKYECWCGLLEIVVAYVYDHLTTMGDSTVESSWTISTLTTGLSYLESPTSIEEVLHSFLRRVAIYPYWRNIEEFGLYVIKETIDMLHTHGIQGIMKCLLHTRIILEKSESYYVNNKLYIDPYLYWIQNFTGEMGHEGLSRILIELESLLLSPPDTDNCLVTEVQNSLGIDVLMEELFHTDSETFDDENSATDEDDIDIDVDTAHDLLATASNENESDIENDTDTGTTTSDTELEVDDAATDDDDDDDDDTDADAEEEDSTTTDPEREEEEEDKTGATPTMTNVSVVTIPTTTTTTMPSATSAAAVSAAASSSNTNRVLLDTEVGSRGGDGNSSSSSSTTTATASATFITEMMTVVGSTKQQQHQQQESDCQNKDEQQQQQEQKQKPLIQEL